MAGALVIAGSAAGTLRLHAIDADPLGDLQAGTVRGFLIEHPHPNEHGFSARGRVRVAADRAQTILLRSYTQIRGEARIGDEFVASGRLTPVDPASSRTPQAASYARYLLRNGVRRALQSRSVSLTGGRRDGVLGAVDSIRARSERTLAFGLAPEPAALLRGMVLGGDAGLPEATADDFRTAGLSHILAVSGQNVLLIVILVQAIAMAAGASRHWRIVLPALVVCIYVPLCGAQASVLRAGAMGLAGLAAIAASRPSSRTYALLLASVFVLAWNPRATADVGAQLSFAAVLGIVAFTKPLSARLRRLPGWMADALAATVGATIATAPLMAFHFGAISVVSLAANVVGEPLIGPIVWLGSLSAAIGQFSIGLGALLNAPNGFLVGALIELAHASAAVPGAQFGVGHFSSWWLVPMAVVICLLVGSLRGVIAMPAAHRSRRPSVLIAVAFTVGVVIALLWPEPSLPPRPSIAFLDVGQGDATLLLGAGGCNALIDGGPPGRDLSGKLRRLGVVRIDLVVATHAQFDHFGGLGELAASGRLHVVDFLDGGGVANVAEYAEIRRRWDGAGTVRRPAVRGAQWRCGDLALRVIAPDADAARRPVRDLNTIAAVTVAEAGKMRMLASGDAESPQLLPLALPNVDVLKVPHHGSADPGLPAVLRAAEPEIAAIEVGADNRYGHPTAQTLTALASAGVATFRTDRDGTVVVSEDASGALRAVHWP